MEEVFLSLFQDWSLKKSRVHPAGGMEEHSGSKQSVESEGDRKTRRKKHTNSGGGGGDRTASGDGSGASRRRRLFGGFLFLLIPISE